MGLGLGQGYILEFAALDGGLLAVTRTNDLDEVQILRVDADAMAAVEVATYPLPMPVSSLRGADLDGDGHRDLLLFGGSQSAQIRVAYGDGNGGLDFVDGALDLVSRGTASANVADLLPDHPGEEVLLTGGPDGGPWALHVVGAEGGSPVSLWSTPVPEPGLRKFALADVSTDGLLDLVGLSDEMPPSLLVAEGLPAGAFADAFAPVEEGISVEGERGMGSVHRLGGGRALASAWEMEPTTTFFTVHAGTSAGPVYRIDAASDGSFSAPYAFQGIQGVGDDSPRLALGAKGGLAIVRLDGTGQPACIELREEAYLAPATGFDVLDARGTGVAQDLVVRWLADDGDVLEVRLR